MCKKSFGLGLAVMYLLSTICYPIVFITPISGIKWIRFMAIISIVVAFFFAIRGKEGQNQYSLTSHLVVLNKIWIEQKHKFIIFLCFLILMILMPVILSPTMSFVGELIDVLIEHIPFLDLIPMRILSWLITELNLYTVAFYVITYILISMLFCANKNTFMKEQK